MRALRGVPGRLQAAAEQLFKKPGVHAARRLYAVAAQAVRLGAAPEPKAIARRYLRETRCQHGALLLRGRARVQRRHVARGVAVDVEEAHGALLGVTGEPPGEGFKVSEVVFHRVLAADEYGVVSPKNALRVDFVG